MSIAPNTPVRITVPHSRFAGMYGVVAATQPRFGPNAYSLVIPETGEVDVLFMDSDFEVVTKAPAFPDAPLGYTRQEGTQETVDGSRVRDIVTYYGPWRNSK